MSDLLPCQFCNARPEPPFENLRDSEDMEEVVKVWTIHHRCNAICIWIEGDDAAECIERWNVLNARPSLQHDREAIPRANADDAKAGWRLSVPHLIDLQHAVEDVTGYSTTLECVEEIVLRTESILTTSPAPGVGEVQSAAQLSELDDASNACLELASKHGYATGHGDTVADMIREFSAQISVAAIPPGAPTWAGGWRTDFENAPSPCIGWCVFPAGEEARQVWRGPRGWSSHSITQDVRAWQPMPAGPPALSDASASSDAVGRVR